MVTVVVDVNATFLFLFTVVIVSGCCVVVFLEMLSLLIILRRECVKQVLLVNQIYIFRICKFVTRKTFFQSTQIFFTFICFDSV